MEPLVNGSARPLMVGGVNGTAHVQLAASIGASTAPRVVGRLPVLPTSDTSRFPPPKDGEAEQELKGFSTVFSASTLGASGDLPLGPGQQATIMSQLQQAIELAIQRQKQELGCDEAGGSLSVGNIAMMMKAVDRKVDDMINEMSAQAIRVTNLELHKSLIGSDGPPMEHFSSAPDVVTKLISAQSQEIDNLRTHVANLEDKLVNLPTQSLELQLRDLVQELRRLQEDQQKSNDGTHKTGELAKAIEVLEDLNEERACVSTMLENVKQEKLEVIAMMHSFAVGKDEALQEFEGVRQQAVDELREEAQRSMLSASVMTLRQQSPNRVSLRDDASRVQPVVQRQHSYSQQQLQTTQPSTAAAIAAAVAAATAAAGHSSSVQLIPSRQGSMALPVRPADFYVGSADTARGHPSASAAALNVSATSNIAGAPMVSPAMRNRSLASDAKRPGMVTRFVSGAGAPFSPRSSTEYRDVSAQQLRPLPNNAWITPASPKTTLRPTIIPASPTMGWRGPSDQQFR